MTTELITKPIFDPGTLPATAQEIFNFTRTELVKRAEPLKELSLSLHARFSLLPGDWQLWNENECSLASSLYDEIATHEKTAIGKGTELDNFRDKADKFKKGILRAFDDIMADVPADKEALMKNIRAWRKREDERAEAERKRLEAIAQRQEEERRLQEALALEEEAEKLKAMGQEGIAAEVMQEAEAVIEEQTFIPPVKVQITIPKGGPKKQTFWKFEVVDMKKLPEQYKLPNMQMIGGIVRAMKGQTKIEGVKVWEE